MERLGKNIKGYLGERIRIHEVLREIQAVAGQHGWASETFLKDNQTRLIALHRPPLPPPAGRATRRAYISTGIHGDEPAGPLAVRRLLERDEWPSSLELWLCPCLNPAGFELNRRENAEGIDLNRQYRNPKAREIRAHIKWLERQPPFDLTLCLHEDWESHGFYIYELNSDHRPSLAESIVEGVARVCPVDPSAEIEGRPARGGIIRPQIDPRSRPDWPEAFYLLTHKTRLSYTLEAPSDFPLDTRAAALVAGVNTALGILAHPQTC